MYKNPKINLWEYINKFYNFLRWNIESKNSPDKTLLSTKFVEFLQS